MQRQARQGAELPDPLARLSYRRTGAGCSSTLTLERAVGGSASLWLHPGPLESQNWGCGLGHQEPGGTGLSC